MRRRVFFSFLLAFPASLFADSTQRYIVTTRHPFAEAVRALPRDDFEPRASERLSIRSFDVIDGFAADLTTEQVVRLLHSGEVEDIEPVVERHAFADSVLPGQQTRPYGISLVNAPGVWPVTRGTALVGATPIHVAIIDTGIDYHSPELRRIYKGGHNFITNTDDPLDDAGHGTHVAGIIAAADDNQGVVGVAPEVDLFSLKILNQCGSGSSENVIGALDWILQKKGQIGGNWVVNLSLGSSEASNAERGAFQRASDAGLLVVAASGNSFNEMPVDGLAFPAAYPTVVSVGAIDADMKIGSFSQRGPQLKVVAPGVSVLSTIVGASVITNDGRQFLGTLPVVVKDEQGTPLDGFCLPTPSISGNFVFCGRGNPADFPSDVRGKIALIERGDLRFVVKAQNAQAAGAIGVVVFDNANQPLGVSAFGNFTAPSAVPTFLPYVFISQADGQSLRATPEATVTLGFGFENWTLQSGTSMASPHAAAVAALAWAVAPTAPATAVAEAVINTAKDLGDAGVDNIFGHGLINALDAAKQLNPAAFGSGGTPPAAPPTGRPPGRRGH
jgi:subtilisin family serine protease